MNDKINNAKILAEALALATGGRFIAEAHASSIFKKFLRDNGLDVAPEIKKEAPKVEVKA